MPITVQIQDSISSEWRNAPTGTRVRFSYSGRWELGLTDTFIEVSQSSYGDYIDVRGESALSFGPIAGNAIVISPDLVQGGATELQRRRFREIELIQKLNDAQNVFHQKAKS